MVNDAVLDFRSGEYSLNPIGKATEVVRASDENIFNTPVFKAVMIQLMGDKRRGKYSNQMI